MDRVSSCLIGAFDAACEFPAFVTTRLAARDPSGYLLSSCDEESDSSMQQTFPDPQRIDLLGSAMLYECTASRKACAKSRQANERRRS